MGDEVGKESRGLLTSDLCSRLFDFTSENCPVLFRQRLSSRIRGSAGRCSLGLLVRILLLVLAEEPADIIEVLQDGPGLLDPELKPTEAGVRVETENRVDTTPGLVGSDLSLLTGRLNHVVRVVDLSVLKRLDEPENVLHVVNDELGLVCPEGETKTLTPVLPVLIRPKVDGFSRLTAETSLRGIPLHPGVTTRGLLQLGEAVIVLIVAVRHDLHSSQCKDTTSIKIYTPMCDLSLLGISRINHLWIAGFEEINFPFQVQSCLFC